MHRLPYYVHVLFGWRLCRSVITASEHRWACHSFFARCHSLSKPVLQQVFFARHPAPRAGRCQRWKDAQRRQRDWRYSSWPQKSSLLSTASSGSMAQPAEDDNFRPPAVQRPPNGLRETTGSASNTMIGVSMFRIRIFINNQKICKGRFQLYDLLLCVSHKDSHFKTANRRAAFPTLRFAFLCFA